MTSTSQPGVFNWLLSWGPGTYDGTSFSHPRGIAVLPQVPDDPGAPFVFVGSGNYRIFVFDEDGNWKETIGEGWNAPFSPLVRDRLEFAVGAIGHLYVSDGYGVSVVKIDTGEIDYEWGNVLEAGADEEEIALAISIATDEDNNVYVADSDNARVHKFEDKGLSGQLPTDPTHTNWGHAKQDWLDLSVGTAAATRSTEKYRDSARQKFSGEIDDVEVMVQTRVNIAFRPDAVDSFSATIAYAEPVNTEYSATFTETGNDTKNFTAEIEVVEGTGEGTQLCVESKEIHTASGPGTFTPIVLRAKIPQALQDEPDFRATSAGGKDMIRGRILYKSGQDENAWWKLAERPLIFGQDQFTIVDEDEKNMPFLLLDDSLPNVSVGNVLRESQAVDEQGAVYGWLSVNPDTHSQPVHIVKMHLDVDNNGSIDDPCDDAALYLPGYRGGECVLYANSSFAPQQMRVVVEYTGPVAEATFRMVYRTRHPGFCSNATDPSIVPSNGDDFSFEESSDTDGVEPYEGQVETDGTAWITLWCKDFGGKCVVLVSLEATDGTGNADVDELVIPLDRDNNGMADAWFEGEMAAARDNDTAAGGQSHDFDDKVDGKLVGGGDGIPAIDEYRGFICAPCSAPGDVKHVRTDPAHKDVFYSKEKKDYSGPEVDMVHPRSDTLSGLGYNTYFLPEDIMGEDRILNRYSACFAEDKHKMRYIRVEYWDRHLPDPPIVLGMLCDDSGQYIAQGYGIPRTSGVCKIFMGRIDELPGVTDEQRENIVLHEMGHSLFLRHTTAGGPAHGVRCPPREEASVATLILYSCGRTGDWRTRHIP